MIRVTLSGRGRSELGVAVAMLLGERGDEAVYATDDMADVAICLYGKIAIYDDPGRLGTAVAEDLIYQNFLYPRWFIEQQVARSIRQRLACHIIVIGSNAARYGVPWATDYAAGKAALNKYVELRGKSNEVRDNRIRLSVLNFGTIHNAFWDNAMKQNPKWELHYAPDKALSLDEAARAVIAVIDLPEHVVFRDVLITSTEYQ